MFFVPQYHTGASAVDILDNRSNFRVLFTKRLDEIVLRREYRGCCHQNDQNLAGCEAAANQYMTQQTVSGVLIKNTDLERTKHTPDRHDDLVCFLILNQTGIHRKNPMCPLFVNARNRIVFPIQSKYRMNFIAVMIRLFHSNDRTNRTDTAQQFFHALLFFF